MPSLLADRLRQVRHERFVGRTEERARFREAVEAEALPFHLLYLHGPGGVGKTALLHELRYLCANELPDRSDLDGKPGPAVYDLDARDVEPTPAAFRQALQRAQAAGAAAGEDRRTVWLIDTFEALQPLERWFQEDFLPQLSLETLVVVAGRHAPPAAWRADAGVQALMREVPLRNLAPEESRQYLALREVPSDEREAVATFACGHPLALSLAADSFDQNPMQDFAPESAPAFIKTLVERFVKTVPSEAHRRALEACALVRALSEPMLEHLLKAIALDAHSPHALFEWLRTLSFVDAGARGLYPHEIARNVLLADLRWRRPQRYDALHRAARHFYVGRLQESEDASVHQQVLSEYLFLYRDNPVVAPLFARLRQQWKGRAFTAEPPRDGDWPALQAMTRRHEGAASADLLAYWRSRPAAHTSVFRDENGAVAGFSMRLALHDVTGEDRARDPAAAAAWDHLEAHAPLRGGERASLFRFWMDRENYQGLSPIQSLISAQRVRHCLSKPGLAFSFITCAEPDLWALIFAYADQQRFEDATYDVGGRSFALFGHDWRATPPDVWLEEIANRNIIDRPAEDVPPAVEAPRLVLSRADFGRAVKDALKDFTRLDRLQHNPLMRSAVVADATEEEARASQLKQRICEAAEKLKGTPRDEKYYRALRTAYLDPVGTQQEAADAVDAAFSTFRRHLSRGIDHVTDVLWKRETKSSAEA